MAVTGKIVASVSGSQTSTLDLGTASFPYSASASVDYASGTGAGQIDLVYTKTNTLAASATGNIDLAASVTDAFGATITFARIKAIFITAAAGNTNDVQVTRPATNGVPFLMAAGDGIALRKGAGFAWWSAATDATGVPVTAGTGDLITFTNSGGTTSVTYTVAIQGCSA